MHLQHEVDTVLRLLDAGLNDSQVSRATGINRSSVREWRTKGPPGRVTERGSRCPSCHGASVDEPGYIYLLGLYLGDGCISREPRSFKLRIVQDARYPHLIALIQRAVVRVHGGSGRVGTIRLIGCVEIYSSWLHWPCLFPQHGPGRKHLRPIVLEDWQRRLVATYPKQLIHGLIHSDGCRVMNRVGKGKYAYPRYFFTNSSEDILGIFRHVCDLIGVDYQMSKPNTVSIARRASVEKLDSFIGPKG